MTNKSTSVLVMRSGSPEAPAQTTLTVAERMFMQVGERLSGTQYGSAYNSDTLCRHGFPEPALETARSGTRIRDISSARERVQMARVRSTYWQVYCNKCNALGSAVASTTVSVLVPTIPPIAIPVPGASSYFTPQTHAFISTRHELYARVRRYENRSGACCCLTSASPVGAPPHPSKQPARDEAGFANQFLFVRDPMFAVVPQAMIVARYLWNPPAFR